MLNDRKGIQFLALDTYSTVGGLQNFNRRVIASLAKIASADGWPKPRAYILRDRPEHLPQSVAADILATGPDRLTFILQSLKAARNVDIVLLGQLNLVPLAPLIKLANPSAHIVLFVHGIEVWNDPEYRKKRFYEPALLRFVDRIASVSRYSARRMQVEFGIPEAKFDMMPNAVDGPVTLPQSPTTGPVLLAVTRMAAHDHGKNLDAVLRAFALLPERLHEARLEIVGDGILRPKMEALAQKLGIAPRVTFRGRVTDEELDACYQRARAFVLPSSKEGFGIVYLEAWKYGVPVICGSRGAACEVVNNGKDGFVVNESIDVEISEAMEKFLADPELALRMGKAGGKKVMRHYLDGSFQSNLRQLLQGRSE